MSTEKNITIKICMGSSCFARGNNQNLELIEHFIFQNNLDASIELIGSRCENKCEKGPYISINGRDFLSINQNQLREQLDEFLLFNQNLEN